MKLRLFAAAAVMTLLSLTAIAAVDPVNKNSSGVALHGYDAVAYFKDARPVKGRSEFSYDWMGAKWYFDTAANRDEFAKNPAKYAPQFGGYCAYAVSKNKTANIDPEAWSVVNGKLYLNYSNGVRQKWEEDVPGNIKKGEENWPGLIKK